MPLRTRTRRRGTSSRELDRRPELAEPSRFEARGRARLDDAAVVRTRGVDAARIGAVGPCVEPRAALAVVLHEAEKRRLRRHIRVFCKELATHTLFVALEEMHGAR